MTRTWVTILGLLAAIGPAAAASNATVLYCTNAEYTLIANEWNRPTPPIVVLMYQEIEGGKVIQNEKSARCDPKLASGGYMCPIEIKPVVGYLANIVPDQEVGWFAVVDPINIPNKVADGSIEYQLSCEEFGATQEDPASSEWLLNGKEALAISSNDSALSFGCYNQGVQFGYSIPETLLDASLVGKERLDLFLITDPQRGQSGSNTYTDLSPTLIDGRFHFRFLGDLVNSWAALARKADSSIQIGLSTDGRSSEMGDLLNVETFTAKGSSAAIKGALAGCPTPQ